MDPLAERDYEPLQPRGTDWRRLLRRITAPVAVLLGLLAKLGSLAKFSLVFVAVGGYALIWGWPFAVGLVLLIFIHEMGHFLEARREGLGPSWPVFVPFLGAYVKHTRGKKTVLFPFMGIASASTTDSKCSIETKLPLVAPAIVPPVVSENITEPVLRTICG